VELPNRPERLASVSDSKTTHACFIKATPSRSIVAWVVAGDGKGAAKGVSETCV